MQDGMSAMSNTTAQVWVTIWLLKPREAQGNNTDLSLTGDEAKPHCQNCIGKNLDCQYGLQVSFLPKNMHTVAAEELPAPVPAPMTDGKHNKFHVRLVLYIW